ERELLPLLATMRAEADGKGRVIADMPPAYDLPRRMQAYLKVALADAELDAHQLFISDATRKRIDWYGATRGTGITWCAVRGGDPFARSAEGQGPDEDAQRHTQHRKVPERDRARAAGNGYRGNGGEIPGGQLHGSSPGKTKEPNVSPTL